MVKEELIAEVAAQVGVTKRVAEAAVEAIIDTVMAAVEDGEKVQLNGFGTFERKHRNQRTGRVPATGEPVTIPARDVPWFTPSQGFRDRLA